MHPMLNIAIRAARNAGNHIIKTIENKESVEWSKGHAQGSATQLDIDAEKIIIHTIQTSYPDHVIVSEHAGTIDGADQEVQWLVDPIDGSANLIKGFPHFAISVAVRMRGKTEVACVYDPIRNELFTAQRGSGAQVNNVRMRLAPVKELSLATVAYAMPKHKSPSYSQAIHTMSMEAADTRRTGCVSLDLCYLAASRVDAYLGVQLPKTTLTAGELIAKEAGVLLTDFDGGTQYYQSGNVVASSPRGVKGLLKHLRELTA